MTIRADTTEAEAAIGRVTERVNELHAALERLLALGIGIRLELDWDGPGLGDDDLGGPAET